MIDDLNDLAPNLGGEEWIDHSGNDPRLRPYRIAGIVIGVILRLLIVALIVGAIWLLVIHL